MANYIRSRKVKLGSINNIPQLKGFGEAVWNFISSIYKSSWDTIDTDNNNNSFRNRVANKFTLKVLKVKTSSNTGSSKNKIVEIVKLPPSIPVHPSKEVLEKSRFFGKGKKPMSMYKVSQRKLYAQVAGPSVLDILKLKENYPICQQKRLKVFRKSSMTTIILSYKQIIVPIGKENANKFMASSSNYIANINKVFKNIKLDIIADYVQQEPIGVVIVTNKVALPSDL